MYYLMLLLTAAPVVAAILFRQVLFTHLWLGTLVCVLYGAAPLLVAWLGLELSQRLGCTVSRIVFQCPQSAWHGQIVTAMVFTHWLAIATIPAALLGLASILFSVLARQWR